MALNINFREKSTIVATAALVLFLAAGTFAVLFFLSNKELKKDIEGYKTKVENIQNQNQKLNDEREDLNKQVDTLNKQLVSLQDKIKWVEEVNKDLNGDVNKANQKSSAKDVFINQLKKENANLQKVKVQLSEEVKKVKTRLASVNEQLSNLHNNVNKTIEDQQKQNEATKNKINKK